MNRINKLLLENEINPSNVTFVDSGEVKITGSNIIATDYTFSCTSLLIWSSGVAYLNHMLPTEATDNEKLTKTFDEIKKLIKENIEMIDKINILVCSGVSDDSKSKFKFHDYTNLNSKLAELELYCNNYNIDCDRYNDVVSKYLIYDPNKQTLILENEVIDINDKKINRF